MLYLTLEGYEIEFRTNLKNIKVKFFRISQFFKLKSKMLILWRLKKSQKNWNLRMENENTKNFTVFGFLRWIFALISNSVKMLQASQTISAIVVNIFATKASMLPTILLAACVFHHNYAKFFLILRNLMNIFRRIN